MQAPRTLTHSPGFSKIVAGVLIAAAALASIVGLSQLRDAELPYIGGSESSRPAITAYASADQGEGKLDSAIVMADYASTKPVIRFVPVNAGEGMVDASTLAVAAGANARAIAHVDPMAGEGRLEARSSTADALQAFPAANQGEGLIDPAN
jgi:hypothetical protein